MLKTLFGAKLLIQAVLRLKLMLEVNHLQTFSNTSVAGVTAAGFAVSTHSADQESIREKVKLTVARQASQSVELSIAGEPGWYVGFEGHRSVEDHFAADSLGQKWLHLHILRAWREDHEVMTGLLLRTKTTNERSPEFDLILGEPMHVQLPFFVDLEPLLDPRTYEWIKTQAAQRLIEASEHFPSWLEVNFKPSLCIAKSSNHGMSDLHALMAQSNWSDGRNVIAWREYDWEKL